jgi:hypothetical protein
MLAAWRTRQSARLRGWWSSVQLGRLPGLRWAILPATVSPDLGEYPDQTARLYVTSNAERSPPCRPSPCPETSRSLLSRWRGGRINSPGPGSNSLRPCQSPAACALGCPWCLCLVARHSRGIWNSPDPDASASPRQLTMELSTVAVHKQEWISSRVSAASAPLPDQWWRQESSRSPPPEQSIPHPHRNCSSAHGI